MNVISSQIKLFFVLKISQNVLMIVSKFNKRLFDVNRIEIKSK